MGLLDKAKNLKNESSATLEDASNSGDISVPDSTGSDDVKSGSAFTISSNGQEIDRLDSEDLVPVEDNYSDLPEIDHIDLLPEDESVFTSQTGLSQFEDLSETKLHDLDDISYRPAQKKSEMKAMPALAAVDSDEFDAVGDLPLSPSRKSAPSSDFEISEPGLSPKKSMPDDLPDFDKMYIPKPGTDEDSAIILEATRELLKTESGDEFLNVLLLLIMGQFAASAVSVITPVDDADPVGKWIVREVRGIKIKSKAITFRGSDPLMGDLLEGKGIVDIKKYSSIEGFRDECNIFYSIGGRYLVPLVSKGWACAVIALGEKLSGDYEQSELDFLWNLALVASQVYGRLRHIEKLTSENKSFVERNTEYSDIERIERDLRRSLGASEMETTIESKMQQYGAESFCFFVRNERGDFFIPRITEKEDLMGFRPSSFSIPAESDLCAHFVQQDDWDDFENPATTPSLRAVFPDAMVIRMNLCSTYPFAIRGHLAGVLMVLRGKREKVADSRFHIMRLARAVFSYLQGSASIAVLEGQINDIISRPILRMERSLSLADDLGIPVSFIAFVFKNMKRYRALFGHEEAEQLMIRLREVICSRISFSDYAVRAEAGKIIVVLSGKTKKYAVPFANAVRNEVVSSFRGKESQIMLSFLISEYPADGKTVYDLLDYLD